MLLFYRSHSIPIAIIFLDMKKGIAFVWMCFVAVNGIAQNFYADSTKQLNVVSVTSNRLENFTTGSKIEQADSILMVVYNINLLLIY